MSAMAASLAAIMLQIPIGEYLGKSCLDSIEHNMVYNGAEGVKLMVYSVMIQDKSLLMRFQSRKKSTKKTSYELVAIFLQHIRIQN